jgi:hypothetical protein
MDEYFKKEDEITLAGIARQDVELYGEQLRKPPSFWERIRAAVRSFLGGSPPQPPAGSQTTDRP